MDTKNLTKEDYYALKNAFSRCLNATYTHVENDGDYALQVEGDTLYILFQWSHSKFDWFSNIDFVAKPYKDMELPWRCHRGFLRVWKSIEPYIADEVANPDYKRIVVVGYSHGAAIATLAHEYVWFHRPDLRDGGLVGYGFGCPRCYFGWTMKKALKERWANFYPVRNLNDLVSHLPPVGFGFTHVNKVVKIGEGEYLKDPAHPKYPKCILAHYDANYRLSIDNALKGLGEEV